MSVGRINHYAQAWRRLVSCAVPQDELLALIETIFLDDEATEMINRLRGGDAQTFIDVMDGVRYHSFFPRNGSIYF